jgi:hypothetical protein
MTNRKQPGRPVQEWSVVLPVLHHRFAGMQRHAYSQWPNLAPIFGKQCTLGSDGSGDGIRSRGKDGLRRITNDFEEHAIVGLNCRAE